MKYGLLGTTALAGAGALLVGGAVVAAEAPEWKLSGNVNFQFYYVDQEWNTATNGSTWDDGPTDYGSSAYYTTGGNPGIQDHGWYFGVDEAELQLNVSGAADNGLNYGFKIEINANTDDGAMADEARISLSGSWGTLHLGDEDGAEDTMNYGGEDLMGATGGFDGDFDDVLLHNYNASNGVDQSFAPSYPTIAGDSGDATKVTYYSPRFSGFQVGASITPQPSLSGDDFKSDKGWENHYGLGANYDSTFGNLHIQASAVYSAASSNDTNLSDISAWSVGGIVGWGGISLGANYTDNGDSGTWVGNSLNETSYWNVAGRFETGAIGLAAGYYSGVRDYIGSDWIGLEESTFENIALTADYSVAPGLGVYAEIDLISIDNWQGMAACDLPAQRCDNDATIVIMGANVSF